MDRAYLDHASTSPFRPQARLAMVDWLQSGADADPGRIHAEGLVARAAVEDGREQVAGLLGARGREVVFTSSASEAIAMATWGAVERAGGHVVVGAVEHSAVRRSAEQFARAVTTVGCDTFGRLDAAELLAAVTDQTALVHVQWANHEVGTEQPVAEVVAGCRERGVLVHVDAAQAAGRVPIAFDELGADLLSVSAHKMGGPTGVGALLVRRGVRLRSLLAGGDQERARRAGLENTAAIVGWGAAAAAIDVIGEGEHQRRLRDRLAAGALALPGLVRFGHPALSLPHLLCLGVEGIEPQAVLLALDQRGVAAHSGSACSSEDLLPSPVLEAMGVDAHHSLRFSVGWNTTEADVDRAVRALTDVLPALRALAT